MHGSVRLIAGSALLGLLAGCSVSWDVRVTPAGSSRFPANPDADLPVLMPGHLPAGTVKVAEIEILADDGDGYADVRRKACAKAAALGAEYLVVLAESKLTRKETVATSKPVHVYKYKSPNTGPTFDRMEWEPGTTQAMVTHRRGRYAGYRSVPGGPAPEPGAPPDAPPPADPGMGYLGLSIQDVPPEISERLKLPPGEGVLVVEVIEHSPAEWVIHVGDVILQLEDAQGDRWGGRRDSYLEWIQSKAPATEITITLVRGEERFTCGAVLGKRE